MRPARFGEPRDDRGTETDGNPPLGSKRGHRLRRSLGFLVLFAWVLAVSVTLAVRRPAA